MKKEKDIFGWVVVGAILTVVALLVVLAIFLSMKGLASDLREMDLSREICGNPYKIEDECSYYKCQVEIINSTSHYHHTRYQTCLLQEQEGET